MREDRCNGRPGLSPRCRGALLFARGTCRMRRDASCSNSPELNSRQFVKFVSPLVFRPQRNPQIADNQTAEFPLLRSMPCNPTRILARDAELAQALEPQRSGGHRETLGDASLCPPLLCGSKQPHLWLRLRRAVCYCGCSFETEAGQPGRGRRTGSICQRIKPSQPQSNPVKPDQGGSRLIKLDQAGGMGGGSRKSAPQKRAVEHRGAMPDGVHLVCKKLR